MPTPPTKFLHVLEFGAALIAVALAASACLAQGRALTLEEQAQRIDKSLMCPVCPGETLDQSQVEAAKQMRAIVREKLAAGESRQQILDFFVARFGQDVLAAPPKEGFNLLAWVVPGVALATFGTVLLLVLRAMRSRRSPEDAPPAGRQLTNEELAPYLAQVDEEMRQALGESPHQGKAGQETT